MAKENGEFDVRVWGISKYAGTRRTTYTVRWRVRGQRFQRTFTTVKLAESFRAVLLVAARRGEQFSLTTGLPKALAERAPEPSWISHASAFIDSKWSGASPRHRKGIAEGLMTATLALHTSQGPARTEDRRALLNWVFNTGARGGQGLEDAAPPDEYAASVSRLRRLSPGIAEATDAVNLRKVLEALGTNLDGSPASPSTTRRKRSALYGALDFAVELGELPTNPLDRLKWRTPVNDDVVDRRVVVNPAQARELLAAVGHIYPSLEAFFACIYFAALRPAEVRHLTVHDLTLPEGPDEWGSLRLTGSTQTSGALWTDGETATEDRQLKHRSAKSVRIVPAPPELVDALRRHLAAFSPGMGGRLFVTRAGRAGVPVAPPFASPQSMGIVYRVWDLARREVLSDADYASPLAKRPYDLRHAAVSLWLNAGVPAVQVAEWAGHSVNVLLRVYASCIVGQEESARMRIHDALNSGADLGPPTSARIPHKRP